MQVLNFFKCFPPVRSVGIRQKGKLSLFSSLAVK